MMTESENNELRLLVRRRAEGVEGLTKAETARWFELVRMRFADRKAGRKGRETYDEGRLCALPLRF